MKKWKETRKVKVYDFKDVTWKLPKEWKNM